MDHVPFEVATYRQEHGFSDGRHPDTVQKGTLEQDVVRRDFTINGLVLNPNTGEVLDLVGGIADLKLRIVRAIGNADERFKEDYLRTLRAIRFAACLDFSLESSTLEAVRLTASGLANISRERIHAELAKICAGHAVPQGLQLLVETGLVDPLFNTAGIDDTAVCRAAGWCLDAPLLGEDVPALLATLLAAGNPGLLSTPLSPEKLDAITGEQAHNFRLANRQHSAMTEILTVATGLLSAQSNRLARRADLYRTDRFHTGLALLEAHRKFRREPLKPIAALVKERDSIPHDRLFPPRWVTGTDLKAAGLAPGPEFGKLLRELSDRIVEGNICNRDEALDWIRGQLSSLPQH
jgi:tRNA nucleotidyltransferase/poly(A) polymerase